MYSKLSLRNVKRSFKDYAIYFLTITLAVCLFYSFNALPAQKVMLDLSSHQEELIDSFMTIIGIISIFITILLAFLILFANRFLIQKRKKELGLYMTLGMTRFEISRVLLIETFLIGLISLGVGLGLGIILSQGLSILTVTLFKVDMQVYQFVFSVTAMLKTILYFSLIYMIVMMCNVIIINRQTLLSLMTAGRKNQRVKMRKTSTGIGLFVLAVLMIGTAYIIVLRNDFILKDLNILYLSVILCLIGSILFFFSISQFLLHIIQKNKQLYYKHLNMFVLRQISSKVNDTFISMTLICMLLFFTITILSTAFSLKDGLEGDLEITTPYDASFFFFNREASPEEMGEKLRELRLDEYGNTVLFNEYVFDQPIVESVNDIEDVSIKKWLSQTYPTIITQTTYAQLSRLQVKEPVTLKENEILFLTNIGAYEDEMRQFTKQIYHMKIGDKSYSISSQGYQLFSTRTDMMATEEMVVVVPDDATKGLRIESVVLNLQYTGSKEKADAEIYQRVQSYQKYKQDNFHLVSTFKNRIYEWGVITSNQIVYIGLYIGIIFLISSACFLALQQLSEMSDNMERFNILKRLGVTQTEINHIIFIQILIYFMVPLTLAVLHSIIGIRVLSRTLTNLIGSHLFLSSIMTAGVLLLIYGSYFLVTYLSYKSIAKQMTR
ncbi:ABC transporter permease [Polycladospora coralii]|nr:ABC transporter permease [Polycladospora coralii]